MTEDDQASKKAKKDNTKWILFIVLALLVGGILGYAMGGNAKETQVKKQYDQQIQKLEEDAAKAKEDVNSGLAEGQEAVAEGQQTLESLQAENATLKNTIDTQTKKIAELEQQLEDAQSSNTPTDTAPTN